jgi:Coenzyme PQQ synthesis protein D (PqqD)
MTAMDNGKNESSIRLSKSVRETINQDGAVLLDIKQGLCFSMNPVGAKIWEMLKQGCPPEAIVDGLEKEFEGVSRGELEMDVTDFLNVLHQRRLICRGEESEPKNASLLSRLLVRRKWA